jgi:hypothetical protein
MNDFAMQNEGQADVLVRSLAVARLGYPYQAIPTHGHFGSDSSHHS